MVKIYRGRLEVATADRIYCRSVEFQKDKITQTRDMTEKRYVALLRGINVGGKNIMRMTALKSCFEEMGFAAVATFIQSGNILFDAPGKDRKALTDKIESGLSKRFNYTARVVLASLEELDGVVKRSPRGFGSRPAEFRYDVLFLMPTLAAAHAREQISPREGVDAVYAGEGVLYFSRLIKRASQSRLARIVQLPIYQQMTIRNWNTTTRLLSLMSRKG